MPLPDRFRDATFDGYDPKTPSQAEALRTARAFVQRSRHSPSWPQRIKRLVGATETPHPDGLYLVGPAGTGKTHLLAATYNALTPDISCAFLHSSTLFRQTETPEVFGNRLADRHAVCCLDEVEIDDPASEMRLVGVMKTLAARGVLLVATSNVEPDQYVSRQFSDSRFERFLHKEFRDRYRVVFVDGEDYRRTRPTAKSGQGWIGPRDRTRSAMQKAHTEASGSLRWWTFEELRRATTEIAHPALIDDLTAVDHFFIEDVSIADPDDALRFLRIIDALYLHRHAPTLYFTARQPPDAWFAPDQHAGVARAVAKKFERTVSRLHALCRLRTVGTEVELSSSS